MRRVLIFIFFTVLGLYSRQSFAQIGSDSIVIPLEGNSWSTSANIRTVYFRIRHAGTIHCTSGPYFIGDYHIKDTGYLHLTLTGREVESITVTGAATRDANFVPNNQDNFFYWGRRGPSVHLNYSLPEGTNAEWFYNEVFVPSGYDIKGSYFMAAGFTQGYFGMQVNSATERHILFSVWSPFSTDDPKKIPDSEKIVLVAKGRDVHAGEFGNEGSGGQSYLNYPWRTGNTYRFLVHAQPRENDKTQFTAWFFAPEEGHWRLIASFLRPQTHSWLTKLHSFLENFEPANGDKVRYVLFDHQWVRTEKGQWIPLTKARFTGDNTARKGYRMDYAGGVKGNAFFLQNCGFFSDYTPLDTWWERNQAPNDMPPDIDFDHLGK
jgi:hypothetical protein